MASWKTVFYTLIILLGVISSFLNETEGGKVQKTSFSYDPPRLRDYIRVKNKWYKKPGDKKKRLRSEINVGWNKLVVNVPNPPVILHEVVEYLPVYLRVYGATFLGLVNYLYKLLWLLYRALLIVIRMVFVIVRLLLQVTSFAPLLLHTFNEVEKPHPFGTHHDHHDHQDYYNPWPWR